MAIQTFGGNRRRRFVDDETGVPTPGDPMDDNEPIVKDAVAEQFDRDADVPVNRPLRAGSGANAVLVNDPNRPGYRPPDPDAGAGAGLDTGAGDETGVPGGGRTVGQSGGVDYQKVFDEGTAAGNDMSWMVDQGLVTPRRTSGTTRPTDDPTDTGETDTGAADFAQPRVTGDIGRVAGVDPANWGNMESTKYRALEFLSAGEPMTINNVARKVASPEFQAMFPGATFDGKDKIDFHGMVDPHSGATLHEIDVLQSADPANPDQELVGYWNDLTNDGGGGMDAGGGDGGGYQTDLGALTESDQLAQIMAQIEAMANGRNPAEIEALQAMLNGE